MQTDELKEIALQALEDLKGVDVAEFDVRSMTSVTDYMIIASGTSDRHVKSLADAVVLACKKAGIPPMGVEGCSWFVENKYLGFSCKGLGDAGTVAIFTRTA